MPTDGPDAVPSRTRNKPLRKASGTARRLTAGAGEPPAPPPTNKIQRTGPCLRRCDSRGGENVFGPILKTERHRSGYPPERGPSRTDACRRGLARRRGNAPPSRPADGPIKGAEATQGRFPDNFRPKAIHVIAKAPHGHRNSPLLCPFSHSESLEAIQTRPTTRTF